MLLLQERIPKATAFYSHPAELSDDPARLRMIRRHRAPLHSPDTPVPEVQLVVERPIPRDGHERGRRVQPLEGSGRHTLARRQYLRQLGHVLLHPRRGERRVLVDGPSADAQAAGELRGHVLRGAGGVSPPRQRYRDAYRDRACRRKTTSNCAAMRITNRSRTSRTIEVTSYAEVVLASPAADALHPAFSNLFVQTEIIRAAAGDPVHAPAALARRALAVDVSSHGRARSEHRKSPTRRTALQFIGRGRTVAASAGHEQPAPLCRAARARCWIRSSPSGVGSRSIRKNRPRSTWCPAWRHPRRGLGLVEKYQDRRLADRVFDLAWTHSQVVLRQIECHRGRRATLLGGWPARSSTPIPRCALSPASAQEPPRAIRALGLCHFRRFADRAAADRRPGQYRSGAPTRAGPRVLALEGVGRGPGDLERRSRRLPATAPRTNHGADCRGPRSTCDGSAGRHLRAALWTRYRTRTAFCSNRWRGR